MKLLADENIVGLDALPEGIEVQAVPGRVIEPSMLRDADALWVRSVTRVDSALLSESRVRFVGTATAGVEHINLGDLEARGISFAAAPGSNAMAVVEYVLAALLHLGDPWLRLEEGATLGIVGYGQVGRRLATFARSMGWSVRVHDPWLDAEDLDGLAADLAKTVSSEVISLHCSLTREKPWPSFHLIDDSVLSTLSAHQWLINASRGDVIDSPSLASRLAAGNAPRLVLDVWEGEPALDWSLLKARELMLATPHIAGYSLDAKRTATQMLLQAMAKVTEFSAMTGTAGEASIALGGAGNLPSSFEGPAKLDVLRTLVGSCYDIADDDRRFRQLETLSGVDERSQGFDRLRKEYPLRREVSVVFQGLAQVQGSDPEAGVGRFLASLASARAVT